MRLFAILDPCPAPISPFLSVATIEPVDREYHKCFSPALGQEMELLVFGHKSHVISTEGGAFAAAVERPLYFVVACFTPSLS